TRPTNVPLCPGPVDDGLSLRSSPCLPPVARVLDTAGSSAASASGALDETGSRRPNNFLSQVRIGAGYPWRPRPKTVGTASDATVQLVRRVFEETNAASRSPIACVLPGEF